jgi:putative addiction module killer protein
LTATERLARTEIESINQMTTPAVLKSMPSNSVQIIVRMEQGNLANVKSVGDGVLEYKIDFGPGYRVYFARDWEKSLILLTGGTKKRQQRDINAAIAYWQDYKRSKRAMR